MRRRLLPEGACCAGALALAGAVAGCSVDADQGEVGIYRAAGESSGAPGENGGTAGGSGGTAGESSGAPGENGGTAGGSSANTLGMVIRDFKLYDANDPSTNPDFHNIACEKDVVADLLGSDGKPVYQAPSNTVPTFGRKYFDQWYRDVAGTNLAVTYPLTLALTSDGQYEYDSRTTGVLDTSTGVSRLVFLPIDDGTPYATAFGNQGLVHNYGFTGELHAAFTYPGQGSLRVRADDDLYVFINGVLAVNLGGIHGADGLELDVSALGLTTGQDYPLDLFYAERAGKTGDLLITTSLLLRPQSVQ